MKVGPEPGPPVFVDPGGTRRRRLRPVAYVLSVTILLVLLALWLSQLGGTSRPPSTPCSTAPAGSTADCP
jgi:hypothetical protein